MSDYQIAVWAGEGQKELAAVVAEGRRFVMDGGASIDVMAGCHVVSPLADRQRLDALLGAGAWQVLLGETALHDSTLVMEAIARHGAERIGIWLPVRRAVASWGFDTTSNADFSVVSVTNPVPRWVVCLADGSLSDVDAQWWVGEMIAAGAATVLVTVIAPEDDDLLACAEMAEIAGERFWLDTGSADIEELRFWVRYGQARKLLLPAGCDANVVEPALLSRLARGEVMAC